LGLWLRWGVLSVGYVVGMGKKKGSGARSGSRERLNPLTGKKELVAGTKAGKKRTREPLGSPLRTHDLRSSKKVVSDN
jgi:hypothetical protein